jgi:hypothetical protein
MSEETKHNEWVYQRLSVLSSTAAGEDPQAALAHYRSYERRAKRLRVQRTAVFAIGIAAVLVLVVPASRGVARQLLDRFYMRRPEAVRANYISIGTANALYKEYATPSAAPRFVFDMGKAREQSGFEPRLPATLQEQLNSGLAVLKLSDPVNMRIKIHVNDLMSAFRSHGIADVRVPRTWEGVEIGYHLGMGVLVVFLGGTLGQSLPPSLDTPPGFPIIDFTEIALRAAGLSATEAHNARNMFVDSGGAFAIVPADAKSNFREVTLKAGTGLLFENDTDEDERRKCTFCAGPHERVLTWAATDRIFQLRSQTMTLDETIALANSIN